MLHTLSPSDNQAVTIQQTVATIGYILDANAKGSLEYPLKKEKVFWYKAQYEIEALDQNNWDNF